MAATLLALATAGAALGQSPTDLAVAAPDSGRTSTVRSDSSRASKSDSSPSIRWLPMEVHRYRASDLDSAVPLGVRGTTSRTGADTGKGLKFAGSKTIKVGVGGDGGVALDQTLFLTAEGELSPGVRLNARLSDGDMPLSSQGSSGSLREVDEIFLEVESARWRLRLGDQQWRIGSDLAPGADRRLRGISAGWKNPSGSATATLGGPQAKWMRVALVGAEGRQEGYALSSSQGGLHGVVVPGSEKVRVNGEPVRRGADADYVVRYAEGLLDFTTRRRISSSDLIEVEFQSADLDYERSFAAGQAMGRTGPLRWEAWAARESDDASHPLAYAPDTSSARILRQAGADSLAAKTASGQLLPLPYQIGEGGLRLRLGDSTAWVGTDLRGSDFDPNAVSRLDSRSGGFFGTGAAGGRIGDFVSQGGTGRVTASVRGQRLDARFHGLSSPDSLGAGSDGLWSSNRPGERTVEEGTLGWALLPGIGIETQVGSRIDATGWTGRSRTSLGVDRGEKQILSELEWVRLDEGRLPLEQTRSKARLAWPAGGFTPSLELNSETRDAKADSTLRNLASLRIEGGGAWRPSAPGVEVGWTANARRDAVRRAPGAPMDDTARSIGSNARLRWSPVSGDVDLEVDWKQLRSRQLASLPWATSSSWLGSANAGFWPSPGLRGQGGWKLSSSSYQPEIPRYDTVPVGTGGFRYDTLLRVVVPSDEGNLRLAGTRLDTSRPAVLASQRSLSAELELEPGKLLPGLTGLLADVGVRAHAEWDETDSSSPSADARIWPRFSDAGLSDAITGRSNLSTDAWWSRGRHRLDFEWTRSLSVQAAPSVSRLRQMDERLQWSSGTEAGHRLDLVGIHGDLRDAQSDRLRLETSWSFDPSLGVRVLKHLELRPGWYAKWADGSEGAKSFQAELQSPYATLRADLPRNLNLRAEVRRVVAHADDLAGSRLTDGFPDGVTWRTQSSLDWAWKDHVQAHAEWVGRKEPARPWFQKLSCEAKALF